MKHTEIALRHARFTLLLGVIALLSGCATLEGESVPAVTVPEVVQMSDEGVPPHEIIDRMRESGTAYRLSAAQLAGLRDKGVADPVINYMQRTYLDAVARRQSLADWDNWTRQDDWWYGGPAFGWADSWMMP
ncbi:MAG: hypothetical protein H6953_04935 [Chromatiaceae bacterium]|nr:hypothetical protein [Chromatiaceae bacterium]MCP5314496.1 hypothetical protein [Chromatiaceae bacterium]